MIYKMKLWQKIFVVSLVTSILLFGFCGIFVVVSGHNLNLVKEYEYANLIADNTVEYLSKISQQADVNEDNFIDVIKNRTRITEPKEIFMILKKSGQIIYSEKEHISFEKQSFAYGHKDIVTIDDVNHFIIEKQFSGSFKEYSIVIVQNLNELYESCNTQLERLFVLCIILAIISAIAMIVFSLLVTNEINQINDAVQIVTSQYYSHRIAITGNDELNKLAENFNIMSETIEKNIKNYKLAIDNFTHEVKTPLTAIIGYAEILKSPLCDEKNKHIAIEYILSESKRLNSLVKKIISFLIVESEKIERKRIDVTEIIEMSCLSAKMSSDLKKIKINTPSTEGIYMYGDGELVVTLIVNLLDNAIKASNEGSEIIIDIEHKNYALSKISIIDFGTGIPSEELDKISQMFYTVDKSRSRKQNGIGLGMYICQSIVNAHSGTMHINSQLGKGTRIDIILPYTEYLEIEKTYKENL